MNNYIIKDIDTYLCDFCERYDIEEEDFLSVFEGDSDYIKVNGETAAYFIEDDTNKVVWVYIMQDEEEVVSLLEKFESGELGRLEPNTWEDFESVDNGVAYRNYKGYYYTLYKL